MRTRDEHLEWCKERARVYLDRGELLDAVTSMGSDLDQHPETGCNVYIGLIGSYTTRPAAQIGVIRKVHIIARDDDSVAFEWQFGKGVTFGDKPD
jgi:hypothetical protein